MRTSTSRKSTHKSVKGAISTDDIKRELTRCLIAETNAVAKVCTEIISWTGPSCVQSWKNPNESRYLIDVLRDDRSHEPSTNYSGCLENYLDIIHTYLQLMADYLNTLPSTAGDCKRPEMGFTGRKVSLPVAVGRLWSRLQTVGQNVYSRTTSQLSCNTPIKQLAATGTQTEYSTLSCEACRTTAEAIQSLVLITTKTCHHLDGSKLVALRKEMTNNVYDTAQLGAMNKWCSALRHDVTLLGVHCKQLVNSNKLANSKLRELQNEVEDAEKKLSSLSEEKELLRRNSTKAIETKAKYFRKFSDVTDKYEQKSKECADAYRKIKKLEEDLEKLTTEKQQSPVKERIQKADLMKQLKVKSEANEILVEKLEKQNEKLSLEIFALRDEASLRESEMISREDYIIGLEKKVTETTIQMNRLYEDLQREKCHAAEMWKKLSENRQDSDNHVDVDAISKKLQDLEQHIYTSIPAKKIQTPHK